VVVKIPQPEESALEASFRRQLMELRQRHPAIVPPWERNYVFLPGRKKQLDFAWPELWFGVEIDGGVHMIPNRFHGDREKQALALVHGWRILPATALHVHNLQAIGWCETLLRRYIAQHEAAQRAAADQP
jgi:hypothetical protein